MKALPYLALTLAAISSLSMAASRELVAGTTINASFESKMAMKGYRIGGAELMQVNGDIKCRLIVETGLAAGLGEQALTHSLQPPTITTGSVSPQALICDEGKLSIPVQGVLLPARAPIGNEALDQVDFIVLKSVSF
ncbi:MULTISPECIES: hypothetical protein [Pseudomonas]|uniref:Uncharacterized protein n=1 Tax=Pseudomonas fluorescens TaxID=294 RepID=A0A166QQS2_PSEFL|nr:MULTISPECIES: hypothetical protein [Pseudomonas]KZN20705.1 hypothetical protein A1D17_03960 [Pseudomonas fluorescens]